MIMGKLQICSWDGKEFFITEENTHKILFPVEAWDLYLFIRDENLTDIFVDWYIRKKEEELHKLKETLRNSYRYWVDEGDVP